MQIQLDESLSLPFKSELQLDLSAEVFNRRKSKGVCIQYRWIMEVGEGRSVIGNRKKYR